MNLLPWRIEQFKQKSRAIFIKTSIAVISICLISVVLAYVNQHFAQLIFQKQEELRQQQSKVHTLVAQVTQLRQQIIPKDKQLPIKNEQIINIINMLNEIPITQGELQQVDIQKGYILLKGTASNQSEFEQIQPFLNQYFPNIKLSQFIPQPDNQLQFQFEQREME